MMASIVVPGSATGAESAGAGIGAGSQTLMRGLDLIEAVADQAMSLTDLASKLDLTKSTTHRLASALVDRGYLAFTPREGYRLGSKLLQLGWLAHEQADLIQVARPHIEALSATTGDTVHLGILDGDHVLYLDKLPGRRRITISSRVGERQPLSSTGLGKALMLDHGAKYWSERLAVEKKEGGVPVSREKWLKMMHGYAATGCAFDLEENEDQVRCVAAPLRGATGRIVAAISVSSAAQYMSDGRMAELSTVVRLHADAISRDLGWAKKN